jgi:hypothetical protein
MATTTRPPKRRRRSRQDAGRNTPGTLVVFSDPPVTIDIGSGSPAQVELGGRLWEVGVDEDDHSSLLLSVSTASDDSKDALKEVLAAQSHEVLHREKEMQALGVDIERLMERIREVCVVDMGCVCMSVGLVQLMRMLWLWLVRFFSRRAEFQLHTYV